MKPIDLLGRKYSSEILAAADEPVSARDLSDELDVPIATCYRRLNELHGADLLAKRIDDGPDGTSVTRYRRTTDAIDIRFGEGVDMYTWPRDARPFRLGRLVSNPFAQLDMTGRLAQLGRTGDAEEQREQASPAERDAGANSSSSL